MSDNVELRVQLIPAAHTALEDTVTLLGFSRTDVVNRAVQLYAYLEMERHINGVDLLLRAPDGTVDRLGLSGDAPEVARRFQQGPLRRRWWRRWAS